MNFICIQILNLCNFYIFELNIGLAKAQLSANAIRKETD